MKTDTTTAQDRLAIALEAVAALRGALKEAEKELASAQKAAEAERLRLALAEQAAQHKAELAALKAAHKEELKRVKAEATAKAKTARKGASGARRKKVAETSPAPTPEPEVPPTVQPEAAPEPEAPEVAAFVPTVGDATDRAPLSESAVLHLMACLSQRKEGVIPCLSDSAVALLSVLDGAVRAQGYACLPDDFSVELSAREKIFFSVVRAGLSFRLMEGGRE